MKNSCIDIFEEDSEQLKKIKKFINRLLDFFTQEFNEKLITYGYQPKPDEFEKEEDEFLKMILRNAIKYSI